MSDVVRKLVKECDDMEITTILEVANTALDDVGTSLWLGKQMDVDDQDLARLRNNLKEIMGSPTDAEPKRSRVPWAIYGDEAPTRPGMYLCLFHGVKSSADREGLDDWGFNGPCIGPLKFVHTTYGEHVKYEFVDDSAALPFREVLDLYGLTISGQIWLEDSEMPFNGCFYGDWTVTYYPKEV